MSGSPHRTQKSNTPLLEEEHVWDESDLGIREHERVLK